MHDGQPIPFFKDDFHLTEDGIALYVDALKLRRTQELPGAVCDHVGNCQLCRKEITGLFSLLAEEDYSAMGPHPFLDRKQERKQENTRWMYRVAALVVAGLGISVIAYIIFFDKENVTPVTSHVRSDRMESVDTTAQKTSENTVTGQDAGRMYAHSFAELPELEGLVAEEMRSSGIDGVSPAIGRYVNQPVTFDWKSGGDVPVILSVLTNKDSLVHRSRIDRLPHILQRSLSPGLYYWKLESGGELVFVGKFLVKELIYSEALRILPGGRIRPTPGGMRCPIADHLQLGFSQA